MQVSMMAGGRRHRNTYRIHLPHGKLIIIRSSVSLLSPTSPLGSKISLSLLLSFPLSLSPSNVSFLLRRLYLSAWLFVPVLFLLASPVSRRTVLSATYLPLVFGKLDFPRKKGGRRGAEGLKIGATVWWKFNELAEAGCLSL